MNILMFINDLTPVLKVKRLWKAYEKVVQRFSF